MSHRGDWAVGSTVYLKFTTTRPSTGATYTLAGTPVVSIYKSGSDAQSVTGVSLTADYDSITGLNHVAVDTSADGTFYSADAIFYAVITTGTVDAVSVTGSVVGSFTLGKVPAGVWAATMTGSTTAIQAMRGMIAAMLGKASGLDLNAPKYRNIADDKNVIDAVTDADGNRTTVTLDLT